MIDFEHFTLDNGLRVIVHEDPHSAIAAVNIMYDVGSRDEIPGKTGFAHLFEHLMFGGSKNIPAYDRVLQQVGGDNNAYTTTDVTNYYCMLPANNVETAFWLESDRMMGLAWNPQVLDVQKKVVIEEFKECYLNQPYGDVWLKLLAAAYTTHPYRWPTIGQEVEHIAQATMDDVRAFSQQFYTPNNAVMVVAGSVKLAEVKRLSEKWFGPIPAGPSYHRKLPQEPAQLTPRYLEIIADVPMNAIYKAYHMPGRLADTYHTTDLLAAILGMGKSSRLYTQLVDQKAYFNNIAAYTTESVDPGLLLISGNLSDGVSFEQAEAALQEIVTMIQTQLVEEQELEKAKNHLETDEVFAEVDILHRAQELAQATLLGDTNLANTTIQQRHSVTPQTLQAVAQNTLRADNCTSVHYKKMTG